MSIIEFEAGSNGSGWIDTVAVFTAGLHGGSYTFSFSRFPNVQFYRSDFLQVFEPLYAIPSVLAAWILARQA